MELNLKNFGKSKIQLPVPYLLKVQTDAWENFLENDLKELFSEISPIRDYTKKELELHFLDYKIEPPKYKADIEAKENDDSYEGSLRINTKLINLKTKESKEQEVFLCDLPIMTERGTFIVKNKICFFRAYIIIFSKLFYSTITNHILNIFNNSFSPTISFFRIWRIPLFILINKTQLI